MALRAGGLAAGAIDTVLEAEGVGPEDRELVDGRVEVVLAIALHEPQLGEAGDHGAQCVGGHGGVEAAVGEAVLLELAHRLLSPLDEVLHRRHAGGVDVLVVARHLLDHAHEGGFVAVPLEVAQVGAVDAAERGLVGVGLGVAVLRRGGEALFLGLGDLPEDLLLRIEVVVEGARCEPGGLGDVDDAGVEEAVTLEDLLGRVDQTGAGAHALAGARNGAGLLGAVAC